jgi:hypothetical protein
VDELYKVNFIFSFQNNVVSLRKIKWLIRIYIIFFAEMWESRGADRVDKKEAKTNIPRRGIQWQTHKNCTLPWKEVPSFCQARDLQVAGMVSVILFIYYWALHFIGSQLSFSSRLYRFFQLN